MTKLSMQFNLTLYALIAFFAFSQTTFGGDEAAKYISPLWLFILKYLAGAGSSILLAIKMFCSTTFSDYMAKVKADKTGQTDFFRVEDTKQPSTTGT